MFGENDTENDTEKVVENAPLVEPVVAPVPEPVKESVKKDSSEFMKAFLERTGKVLSAPRAKKAKIESKYKYNIRGLRVIGMSVETADEFMKLTELHEMDEDRIAEYTPEIVIETLRAYFTRTSYDPKDEVKDGITHSKLVYRADYRGDEEKVFGYGESMDEAGKAELYFGWARLLAKNGISVYKHQNGELFMCFVNRRPMFVKMQELK